MSKFEIDLDQVAFDQHGQQIGVEVSEEMLDGISGGGNGLCGADCGSGDNSVCGISCSEKKEADTVQ